MAAVNGQQQVITCPVPDMSHVEKFGFLFGYPIAHSLSPMFHKAVYQNLGLSWEQFFLESTDIPQFLELTRQPQFFGKFSRIHSQCIRGKDGLSNIQN